MGTFCPWLLLFIKSGYPGTGFSVSIPFPFFLQNFCNSVTDV
uniref:Uncharacterized protein n=1 Tax=Siphoviridae sp. ctXQq5 TaxID=2826368 RepID=A0A8S5N0S7_9CAUD|nr:MAG TPA: hypothetical protein [Siphoviridae sp. ctXQq5]